MNKENKLGMGLGALLSTASDKNETNNGIQKINMNASNVNISGKGKISVKDVSWMDQCIAGTTITEQGINSYKKIKGVGI